MTRIEDITEAKSAACALAKCRKTFHKGDLLRWCLGCGQVLHATCWGHAQACPCCGRHAGTHEGMLDNGKIIKRPGLPIS